ncbi:hypothetical protein [Mycobacterium sp.]|uniref:type II toxin-antitoxin system VapC family toxin n=1 Tax=Mycobacterium sp. TaxID=1785 RepID=UPI0031DA0042
MRVHITVDNELVAELDRRPGSRRRSAFIAELIRRGLDDEHRWTCAISIEEIWRGLLLGEDAVADRLARGLRCAPLGPSEGVRAGGWRCQFAARGVTLHPADCLIAAATAGTDARLATGNPADFPMDDITVEHWPVEH